MIQGTQDILDRVIKRPEPIYGLKWRPSLEGPNLNDDTDWWRPPAPHPPRHFTDLDHKALIYAYGLLDAPPKLIVEIGVNRSETYEVSSTSTLLKLKPQECMYIGIDLDDKSAINNLPNNVYTIRGNSSNHAALYQLMDWYGHSKIDFMFVDGWHSVNQVLTEWKYWERMIPNGVMAFHDTNYHPGPVAVLDAIDTSLFSVEYFGRGESDWGVGVVKRI